MKNNTEAKQRYAIRMESIKNSLERLTEASNRNFGVESQNANWCDVTLAHDIDEALKALCDKVFQEGEYAR